MTDSSGYDTHFLYLNALGHAPITSSVFIVFFPCCTYKIIIESCNIPTIKVAPQWR